MTEYVTTADALFFHRQLIEQYGGAAGVRDVGALESALHRPQTGYYESIIHEAAALLESLIQNHPFADGNGRTGRALALWELYRRGFDTHHIFSVDEYYWEDRPRYYAALDAVRREGEDLTSWLEYCAEGLRQTLERVWLRVQAFNPKPGEKLVLRPKQERLLQLLSRLVAEYRRPASGPSTAAVSGA